MATRRSQPERRALADIGYNSIMALDQATSSDDDAPASRGMQADYARGAIGVSIGHQQSRLTSPTTPAVEKAAALDREDGFFADAYDGSLSGTAAAPTGENIDEDDGSSSNELHDADPRPGRHDHDGSSDPERPQERLPSPWRAGPKQFERTDKTRSMMRDGFSLGRRRASSGPESKSFFASLPSMPKDFSLKSPSFKSPFSSLRGADGNGVRSPGRRPSLRRRFTFSSSNNGSPNDSRSASPHKTPSTSQSPLPSGRQSPREAEEAKATVAELPNGQHLRARPPVLRRSTSDGSLVTRRTLSRVSSLGDDTRFDHVHDMVNSRFKAIKDSFADSSFRLPSMPSIPNFNAPGNFLNRERSASSTSKIPINDLPHNAQHGSKHARKPVDPITMQPYASVGAAFADAPIDKSSVEHPNFTMALEDLEGDIVVLGGYRGSILRSAEAPHRQLWVPIKVGLNLRKVDLEVGIEAGDDERPSKKVIPGGMLTHIGPVDISRRLLKRLRGSDNARAGKLRVHEYGYDWRLHPLLLSKQLRDFLETLPCNQPGAAARKSGAFVIAHSLGGLITRHAVNQRPELFSGVVYAGVPQTCVNILGPIRNGDEVLLSSRVLTAQVNFTIRTSFALLPLDGKCFFDKETKEEYPVDFFDPQTWIEHRLSPCIARPLPPLAAPPKASGIAGYVSSMANAFPSISLPGRKGNDVKIKSPTDTMIEPNELQTSGQTAFANGNIAKPGKTGHESDETTSESPSVRTTVTIPREEAIGYLTRTLRTVKKFKQELAFNPAHHSSNSYPPISVIYGKTTPTVYGARVNGRVGIKHADAYDDLAFGSGDGVVLARAAMVPEGYRAARGGVVSSERGHVTLLGDLEAVGRCINAVVRARRRGVGVRGDVSV